MNDRLKNFIRTIAPAVGIIALLAFFINSSSYHVFSNNPSNGFSYYHDEENGLPPEEGEMSIMKTDTQVHQVSTHSFLVSENIDKPEHFFYLSKQVSGVIGRSEGSTYDYPSDNIFNIHIDKQLNARDKVWVSYQLKGVDHFSGVSCSVNDRYAFGGYLIKTDTTTRRQRVSINPSWLKQGDNQLKFGISDDGEYEYSISELVIEVERGVMHDDGLVINSSKAMYDGLAYIHGFVQHPLNAIVRINGKMTQFHDGEFEQIVSPDSGYINIEAIIDGKPIIRTIKCTSEQTADYLFAIDSKSKSKETHFDKGVSGRLENDFAALSVPTGIMLENTRLSVVDLRKIDLPAMGLGMTNVTDQKKGVRFLPHGEHFGGEGATVALKYDRTLIPDGYTEDDILTFYFDPSSKSWETLEKDSVNKELCMVVSKTTHFTDMINGVIQTPESPESQGFAPTMMNDIKAADPSSKINLIAPPTANNQGTANLSYQLELPPARNGMSPQLAITYNSDAGSGWLGEGWDLNVPGISVDTRFGVPTYDSIRESETYLLDGMMLARAFITGSGTNDNIDEQMFFPDRGVVYKRNLGDNKMYRFYPRIEGSFSEIIRIGVSPKAYSWRVTDKNGCKYYYGSLDADSAILKNPDNTQANIAEWKLKSMIDIHGDSISYTYKTLTETVYQELSAKSIYPEKIESFTLDHLTNTYKKHTQVLFYSNTRKSKKMNNARYGFLVSNTLLLDSIVINHDSVGNGVLNKLRSYTFTYKSGDFNTDLLEKITHKNNLGVRVSDHTLNYHNKIADGQYYNSPINQSPAPEIEKQVLGKISASVFGVTTTDNSSATLYVGLGTSVTSIQNSIGLNSSYSYSATKGESTLIDINGDGLIDKVFIIENQLAFIPQYPAGIFDLNKARSLSGAPAAFLKSIKEIFSVGIAGSVSGFSGRVDKDLLAKSITKTYFSDVNGDGLVDIIHDENVYFNYISGYLGNIAVPAFTKNSSMTEIPMTNKTIYNTEPVAHGVFDYSSYDDERLRSEASPMQDIVRVWEAPYTGLVSIYAPVRLLPPPIGYDSLEFEKADGVRVAIQHKNEEIWFRKISKYENDYIDPYDGENPLPTSVSVNRGDKIYFRVQCGDSISSNEYYDNVVWNLVISCVNDDYSISIPNDPSGYSYTVFRSDESMVNKSGYNEIDSGVPVFISSRFIKSVITVDTVKLSIYSSNSPIETTRTLKHSVKYGPNVIADDTLNFVNLPNNTDKYFWFVISSKSNYVKWDKLKWEPEIKYSYNLENDSLVHRVDRAGVNYDIFFEQPNIHEYTQNHILEIPNGGNYIACAVAIDKSDGLMTQFKCYPPSPQDILSDVIVKIIDVDLNQVVYTREGVTFNNRPYESTFLFDESNASIQRGHRYKIEVFSNSSVQLNSIYTFGINIYTYGFNGICDEDEVDYYSTTLPTIYNKYHKDKNQEYGLMWRNWGQFEYNAANFRFSRPIVEDSLFLPRDSDNISLADMHLIPLAPDFKTKSFWQGYCDKVQLRGDTMVPARLIMNNIVDLKTFVKVDGPSRAPSYSFLVLNNDELQNQVIVKPDNPKYHIKAPNIESREPNILSLNCSATPPLKFLEKIGVSIGVSRSHALSQYEKLLDYVDMNGDGFPDYFNNGRILYSNSRGTQFANDSTDTNIESSTSEIISFGISGSKQLSATTDAAQSASEAAKSMSLSASVTNTKSMLNYTYVDINGDGLPDMINHLVDSVQINLGYGFSKPGVLSTFKIFESNFSANAGLGLGYERDDGFALGTGIASTYSTNDFKLFDINGDGLVDVVQQGIVFDTTDLHLLNNITSKSLIVRLNTGDGFETEAIDWKIGAMNQSSISKCVSLNFACTFGIPVVPSVNVVFNPSTHTSETNTYSLSDIRDYNGDGIPDLLSTSSGSDNMEISLSKISYTNKLQSVVNSLGGKIEICYKRSLKTSDHPGGKWVMDSVKLDDGIPSDGSRITFAHEYLDGKYDRRERQFRGFGEIISRNLDSNNGNAICRKTVQKFDISNYYAKNNLLSTRVYDSNDKIYQQTENIYYSYDVKTFRSVTGLTVDKYTFNEFVPSDSIVAYTPLKFTKNIIYDSLSHQLTSSQQLYSYNVNRDDLIKPDYLIYGFGELNKFKYTSNQSHDLINDTTEFDYETQIEYKPLKPNEKYVTGLPVKVTVRDRNNNNLRQVKAYYTHTGYPNHLTRISQTLNSDKDSAVTTINYDMAGNIIYKKLPSEMSYTYTYDTRYKMYLTQVKDTFGYNSKLDNYDYRFGIPLKTTDINGNIMLSTLDNIGRLTSVRGPNEIDSIKPYTIKFEYYPQDVVINANGTIINPAHAVTKHFDPEYQDDEDDIETVTFVDGFAKVIQIKKDGFVDGQSKMIVSGGVKYDALGRPIESYYPKVNELSQRLVFDPVFDAQTPTRTSYDVLDRVVTTALPDGSTTKMTYEIVDGYLKTTVEDALKNIQETFTNGSGLTMRTTQYSNVNEPITTQFAYDPINQLIEVTDAMGKKTTSVYDKAGRRTQVTHPASGTMRFTYDHAGNLTARTTANMDSIIYEYEFNRLKRIKYPRYPENNVTYTYGDSTGSSGFNRKGRLVYMEDGSGGQEFKYGKIGEITELRRTMVIPNQAVATYVTQWQYDSWNRLHAMTYPDGEVVNYTYNKGGLLTSVVGNKDGNIFTYVDDVSYDKFEQRTKIDYGNGSSTLYSYNLQNRLLNTLMVTDGGNNTVMNNQYTYDDVQNITKVTNSGTSANTIGGAMEHNYHYDNLYRLDSASGAFVGDNGKKANYSLAMGYDNMHNITHKRQDVVQQSVKFDGILNAGYDLSYTYANNSQQIANIADASYRAERSSETYATGSVASDSIDHKTHSYRYDANGNLLYVGTGKKINDSTLLESSTRRLLWDEDNRLLAISDNGFVSNYWYDASGERTVKQSGGSEGVFVNGVLSAARTQTSKFTAYVSPYLVVSNGGNYSKHIYVGSQRITSKLSNSLIFNESRNPLSIVKAKASETVDYSAKFNTLTGTIAERFDSLGVIYKGTVQSGGLTTQGSTSGVTPQYFYHPDHLGSSSLITDENGLMVQHIQYVPFGEVFVEERTTSWSTPYKFNAKELDPETGLYYYHARYYDPRTSVWLSVDPLAEKMPNVSSYVYCDNNPIIYLDPDGREKVVALSSTINRNIPLIKAAENYPENKPVIHIWSHGDQGGLELGYENNDAYISSANQLNKVLLNVSEIWKDREENSFAVIVLHACEAGKGPNSFAEELSNSEEFKNVLIIAPNKNVAVSEGQEIGVYSSKTQENEDGETETVKDKKGAWVFYLNGKKVNAMDGDTKPIFRNLETLAKQYEISTEQ